MTAVMLVVICGVIFSNLANLDPDTSPQWPTLTNDALGSLTSVSEVDEAWCSVFEPLPFDVTG